MTTQFPHIFEPFTVKRTTFRNRVIMPPMGSNYATFSGEVSEEMKNYYGLRAKGGTALITVENACIDYPWLQTVQSSSVSTASSSCPACLN